MTTKNTVVRGSTAAIQMKNLDTSGSLTAVGGVPTVIVTLPDGSTVGPFNMTQQATGQWVYYYATSSANALGTYEAEVTVNTDTSGGTRNVVERLTFKVIT